MTARSALIAAAFLASAGGAAGQTQAILVTDVNVVDVTAGTVAEGQSILIEDGRIAAVGSNLEEAAGRFDADGAFAIPGLWDSHVHVFSSPTEPETALPLYLMHGVTGIRDMGALWPIEEQQALQRRIESGEVLGPRLVLSGAWVDAAPGSWPGMFLADTPEEARAVVDRIASEGWAAVKSYSMLDEFTYLALAEAADAHGLPLVGHVPERVALGTAIDAGQDGMEHFGRVTMACSTAEAEMLADLRAAMEAGADQARILRDHGRPQPRRARHLGPGALRGRAGAHGRCRAAREPDARRCRLLPRQPARAGCAANADAAGRGARGVGPARLPAGSDDGRGAPSSPTPPSRSTTGPS